MPWSCTIHTCTDKITYIENETYTWEFLVNEQDGNQHGVFHTQWLYVHSMISKAQATLGSYVVCFGSFTLIYHNNTYHGTKMNDVHGKVYYWLWIGIL